MKTPKISTDTLLAAQRIARQLNLGVAGVVFVDVESAQEVKQGLAMMRFKSKGGIRPDDVGSAPASSVLPIGAPHDGRGVQGDSPP